MNSFGCINPFIMKFFNLMLIAFTVLPFITLAQSNYKPGYVIKNNGDTVKGYINSREWNKSPKEIEFKKNTADQQPTLYTAVAIKSFCLNASNSYISYIGPVSMGRTFLVNTLSHALDTSVRQDSAFLKVISTGQNVSLLYHSDNTKERYFVSEKHALPYELQFHQYMFNDDRLITDAPFINQLDRLLKKYSKANANAAANIANEDYNEHILVKYVRLINNNNDNSARTPGNGGVRLFVGPAAAYNVSLFTKTPADFQFASRSATVAPSINFGVDFLNNPDIQKSFFRIEASLMYISPTFNGSVGYFTFKQLVTTITPQYIINVYNGEKFKYFVSAGVGFFLCTTYQSRLVATQSNKIAGPDAVVVGSYNFLQVGQYYNNPYAVGTIEFNAKLKMGVVINKKTEIYGMFIPYSVISGGQYNNYQALGGALGVNYLFGAK